MKKLTFRELIFVASMLFGLFFGAGNLIFPASMGQMAGGSMWQAAAGFLITGVGLPLLGVAALGDQPGGRAPGTEQQGGQKVRTVLYLHAVSDDRPLFRDPRCATVSYTVGIGRILPGTGQSVGLAVFSSCFLLQCSSSPFAGGDPDLGGKVLNPLFLCFLGILVVRALISPMGGIGSAEASGAYADSAFFTGLLEGYNTMDALAGLAFGIIVVDVIRSLGVEKPEDVAESTVKAGLFSSLLMAVIYILVTVIGAQSRGVFPASANGGEALADIADYYFGSVGAVILAVTVTVACLKTAVGLITSCGETFAKLFPKGPSYSVWAVIFCIVSFLIANLGLDSIIAWSMPVLMFLYPVAIVLVALTLTGRFFGDSPVVLRWTPRVYRSGSRL